jgi:hypothetical protein
MVNKEDKQQLQLLSQEHMQNISEEELHEVTGGGGLIKSIFGCCLGSSSKASQSVSREAAVKVRTEKFNELLNNDNKLSAKDQKQQMKDLFNEQLPPK